MTRPRGRTIATISALSSFVMVLAFLARADEPHAQTKDKETQKAKPAPPALKVVSSEKAKETKRSQFLRPPGTDRYSDDSIDWSEVPEWRQTTFFGIRAEGRFFIYVVDCSGSMIEESRLDRAKAEIRRSVWQLREPQKFKVIFYNGAPIPMPGDMPMSAGLTSKNQLLAWMRMIEAEGDTDPRAALSEAIALRPDAIFLLSDGEYPEGTVEAVAKKNPRKVPIHCIDLSSGMAAGQLQRIAKDSGGKYVSRPRQ